MEQINFGRLVFTDSFTGTNELKRQLDTLRSFEKGDFLFGYWEISDWASSYAIADEEEAEAKMKRLNQSFINTALYQIKDHGVASLEFAFLPTCFDFTNQTIPFSAVFSLNDSTVDCFEKYADSFAPKESDGIIDPSKVRNVRTFFVPYPKPDAEPEEYEFNRVYLYAIGTFGSEKCNYVLFNSYDQMRFFEQLVSLNFHFHLKRMASLGLIKDDQACMQICKHFEKVWNFENRLLEEIGPEYFKALSIRLETLLLYLQINPSKLTDKEDGFLSQFGYTSGKELLLDVFQHRFGYSDCDEKTIEEFILFFKQTLLSKNEYSTKAIIKVIHDFIGKKCPDATKVFDKNGFVFINVFVFDAETIAEALQSFDQTITLKTVTDPKNNVTETKESDSNHTNLRFFNSVGSLGSILLRFENKIDDSWYIDSCKKALEESAGSKKTIATPEENDNEEANEAPLFLPDRLFEFILESYFDHITYPFSNSMDVLDHYGQSKNDPDKGHFAVLTTKTISTVKEKLKSMGILSFDEKKPLWTYDDYLEWKNSDKSDREQLVNDKAYNLAKNSVGKSPTIKDCLQAADLLRGVADYKDSLDLRKEYLSKAISLWLEDSFDLTLSEYKKIKKACIELKEFQDTAKVQKQCDDRFYSYCEKRLAALGDENEKEDNIPSRSYSDLFKDPPEKMNLHTEKDEETIADKEEIKEEKEKEYKKLSGWYSALGKFKDSPEKTKLCAEKSEEIIASRKEEAKKNNW